MSMDYTQDFIDEVKGCGRSAALTEAMRKLDNTEMYIGSLEGAKWKPTSAAYFFARGSRFDMADVVDFSEATNASYMFAYNPDMVTVPDNLSDIDTSLFAEFDHVFAGCDALVSTPDWNTKNVASFEYAFQQCYDLATVPNWDTSGCENFCGMFYSCQSLTDIPELNTSKGVNFSQMFFGCSSLTTIPVLDTSKGTTFSSTFMSCKRLTTAPEWDTSKATTLYRMYYSCESLVTVPGVDVGSADYTQTNNVSGMFYNCFALTNLNIYNVRASLTIGSGTKYGHLLTVDSLVHTIQELCTVGVTQTLTMGSANKAKINNLYCRIIDDTNEKKTMELCESTDEGAMTLEEYAFAKNWSIA